MSSCASAEKVEMGQLCAAAGAPPGRASESWRINVHCVARLSAHLYIRRPPPSQLRRITLRTVTNPTKGQYASVTDGPPLGD